MQGYQFAHVETWSVAGSTGSIHHESGARKNGHRAWTASEIFDEAERVPGATLHVDRMAEGPQIIAGAVASFDDLRAAHAAAAAVKETFDYPGKDGRRSTRSRKLRKDARSLYTAVFSLPVDAAEARHDPMLRDRCLAVLEEAIAHERARLEALGGTHLMSVVHWDEANVHVHMFVADQEHGRVNALHPGMAAKETFMEDPGHCRLLTKKDLNRGGDGAYKAAMRAWQDDLHTEVFGPAGLLRVGPRRERLPRADYAHAKRAASERQEDRERQQGLTDERARMFWMALKERTPSVALRRRRPPPSRVCRSVRRRKRSAIWRSPSCTLPSGEAFTWSEFFARNLGAKKRRRIVSTCSSTVRRS